MATLKDRSEDVRTKAARALGEIGDASAASDLLKLLKDSSGRVREDAAEALTKIGHGATPALTQALKDRDRHIRDVAAMILGRIKDPNTYAKLTDDTGSQ